MTYDLIIFVPTRGRPDSAMSLQVTFEELCTAKTQVVFVLDADDSSNYPTNLNKIVVNTTRRGMTQALNLAFRRFRDEGRLGFAVGFMGDDHRPRSRAWDSRYLEELERMGTGFVYGNDLFQGERIPTQIAMTTNIPLKLGGMVPDELHHLYVDDYWKAIGTGIGRISYLDDVVVEHLHYLNGKVTPDEGYHVVNSSKMAQHDARAFKQLRRLGKLRSDISSLKELL